jgi:uncharacterized protein involved in cysteine biosynthesis
LLFYKGSNNWIQTTKNYAPAWMQHISSHLFILEKQTIFSILYSL